MLKEFRAFLPRSITFDTCVQPQSRCMLKLGEKQLHNSCLEVDFKAVAVPGEYCTLYISFGCRRVGRAI